jgi:hypothetical protein
VSSRMQRSPADLLRLWVESRTLVEKAGFDRDRSSPPATMNLG